MIKLLIISSFLFTVAFSEVIKYNNCSGYTGEVRLTGCDSPTSCIYKRGDNPSMEIDFVAQADSKTLTAEFSAHIGSADVPYPSFERDACNGFGVSCPITKGTKYTYKYSLKVLPEYPKIKTSFKFSAKDDSGNTDFCFTMPVQIVE